MERTFENHYIRNCRELGGSWRLTILSNQKEYTVQVPSCWEQEEELYSYVGKARYRKEFYLREQSSVKFVFKGVGHTADVYVDGVFLTHHYDSYTPFEGEIFQMAQGWHTLEIVADNSYSDQATLHKPNDYYSYGGIIRPVYLQVIHDVLIQSVHVTPIWENGVWRGETKVVLKNLSNRCRTVSLQGKLHNTEMDFGSIILEPKSQKTIVRDDIFDGVSNWNCQTPNLYQISLVLFEEGREVDDLIDRVGFRQIEIRDSFLYLNGEKLFLKGFNRHEDYGIVGSAVPLQLMEKDVSLILQTGANAVRTSHYPNDERFLDLCDEKGILVWEEAHARGLSEEQMSLPLFVTQSKNSVCEMIGYHYNHPSIVIWGILNECASDTQYGKTVYQTLYHQMRKMDQSRLVTSASCQHLKDLCLGLPDIVSFNIYPQWYTKDTPKEFFDREYQWVQTTDGKGKPFILSEFGAGAIYGFREPGKCKWSEERQAEILEELLTEFLSRKELSGVFIWQFADCRVTEEEWWPTRPRSFNNKGIVNEYRQPKLAYETVKRLFQQSITTD